MQTNNPTTNKPCMIMLVGLPASGKSYYSKVLAKRFNATIHSSDAIREEIFGDVNNQSNNELVFKTLHDRIQSDLKRNISVIYDSCNISYKRRKHYLQSLNKIPCTKLAYLIATPYSQCLEENKNRDRFVPEYVIKRMYKGFDVPAYFEGWDDVRIVWRNSDLTSPKYNMDNLFDRIDRFEQDNPHHSLTLGEHCSKCADLVSDMDQEILYAALLHDIGKEFTKEFKNGKGEPTEIAHYYNHMNISAYEALFYLASTYLDGSLPLVNNMFEDICKLILNICQLIRWHMQPYFIKDSQKATKKFINLVGKDFYDKLMILHQADKLAH